MSNPWALTDLRCVVLAWSADGRVLLGSFAEPDPFLLTCVPRSIEVGSEVDVEMRIARDDAGRIEAGEVLEMIELPEISPEGSLAAWRAWFKAVGGEHWDFDVEDPEAVLRAEVLSA